MLIKNKKLAKVSFFLFLFFSFFALGFTLTNTVSAYTSQDMPSGYRQVTQDDVGKVFGVDLEPVIYFDTSRHPSGEYTAIGFTDYDISSGPASWMNVIYQSGPIYFRYDLTMNFNQVKLYDDSSSTWLVDSLDLSSYTDFISYPFSIEFVKSGSSFIYVKDIERLTLIESILSLFNNLVIWIPSVLTGLILMFYSSETGLTFLGALACASLGISVIFLLISIVSNFLHFRG